MDFVEIVENEVEQRASRPRGSVHLSSLVDLDLSHLRLFHLLLDLRCCSFRRLEIFNEFVITEEVAGSGGESCEQRVLEPFQSDLELVLLPGQLGLQGFQIGSFLGDDLGQELVLQSVARDGEI